MMSVTQDAKADERWAAALGMAYGVIDDQMPRRRRIAWLWLSALIVGSWLLGFLLAAFLPDSGSSGAVSGDEDGSAVRFFVGLAFQAVGVLVAVVGFIWAVRTGRYITRWRSVASPLNLRERKWVQKQIRSGTPVEDDLKRTVVIAMATQSRRVTVGILPLFVGITLMTLGTGVSSTLDLVLWLELVAVLAFIVGFVIAAWEFRRAGEYIERFAHPTGNDDPPLPGS